MDNKLADTANEYSDATRLCQARSAIRQLKADVKAMDVLIGAKSATLLGKQLGRQHAGEGKVVWCLGTVVSGQPLLVLSRGGFRCPRAPPLLRSLLLLLVTLHLFSFLT